MPNPELPVRLFKDDAAWEAWLARQHARSPGLWLRIAKAGSKVKSVTYPEALDVALSYGWIDGQKKTFDDATWLQKFTPRGKRSMWSKINRDKVQRLIERTFPHLPDHVRVIPAEEDISPANLYQLIDGGVTVYGTAGLEIALVGKPVIVAGEAHYGGLGFTYEGLNPVSYHALLRRAASIGHALTSSSPVCGGGERSWTKSPSVAFPCRNTR